MYHRISVFLAAVRWDGNTRGLCLGGWRKCSIKDVIVGWNGISPPQPHSQASVLLFFLIIFFEEGSEPLLGGKVEFWSGNGTRHKRKHGIACPDICSQRILDMERENSRLSHDLEYLSAKGSLGAT